MLNIAKSQFWWNMQNVGFSQIWSHITTYIYIYVHTVKKCNTFVEPHFQLLWNSTDGLELCALLKLQFWPKMWSESGVLSSTCGVCYKATGAPLQFQSKLPFNPTIVCEYYFLWFCNWREKRKITYLIMCHHEIWLKHSQITKECKI